MDSINGPRYFSQWLSLDAPSSSDVAYFSFRTDQFLVVTSFNNERLSIYKFERNSVTLNYSISVEGSVATKAFYIGDRVYLAVACKNANSLLYAWVNNALQLKQSFKTYDANYVDVEVTKNKEKLLVFTSYYNKTKKTYHVPSLIYKWNEALQMFQLHQYLASTGAKRAHFFNIRSDLWLTIACEKNDADSNGGVDSYVYKWNGTHFNVFTKIMTFHSYDVYPLVAGSQVYLIATNYKINGNRNVQSTIYKLDQKANKFNEFGSFFTQGATAVEYFKIKSEYFIAVANSYNETSYSSKTNSLLYRFDGFTLKEFQTIPTIKAVDIQHLLVGPECPILAVVSEGGNVVLYQWEDVTAWSGCYY